MGVETGGLRLADRSAQIPQGGLSKGVEVIAK